jgi:CRISPR-associated protein Cas5h
MKTLIFDLWGDWGHFRKFYSTSSPLTFSIIPPTAAFGVLGAILGLSKEENQYLKILNQAKTKVAIGLNQPVKKTSMGMNYINTKGNIWIPKQRKEGARSPIRVEYLRYPHFRLYVSMEDGVLYSQLSKQLKHQENVYTLCLGLSECIAQFQFIDEVDFVEKRLSEKVEIHSITPLSSLLPEGVPFLEGKRYKKERLPIIMNEDRVVQRYEECLIEINASSIIAQVNRYWESDRYRIVFLTNGEERNDTLISS